MTELVDGSESCLLTPLSSVLPQSKQRSLELKQTYPEGTKRFPTVCSNQSSHPFTNTIQTTEHHQTTEERKGIKVQRKSKLTTLETMMTQGIIMIEEMSASKTEERTATKKKIQTMR